MTIFALLIMLIHMCIAESARVLLIPHNVPSHFVYFGQFANALVSENHEATILVPSSAKKNDLLDEKVNIETYQVTRKHSYFTSKEMGELQVEILKASAVSKIQWFNLVLKLYSRVSEEINGDCEDLFTERVLFERLENRKYNIVITDLVGFECYLAYNYKLGIPYAPLTIPFGLWVYGVSSLPSTWPGLGLEASNDMTFFQRFENLINELLDIMFMEETDYYVKKYVPEKPVMSLTKLMKDSVLWFYLYDQSISYPKVSMPNTIDVADVMIRKPNSLAKEYKDILDKGKDGIILVSLGSFFDHVPDEWLQKFCKSFSMVNQIIIWKLKFNPPCTLSSNIYVKSWVPQNDLLAQKQIKLFITHAGYNSYIEGIANAVPMITLPLFIDQPHNAFKVQHKGIGIKMNLLDFTPEELANNVNRIINNDTYYTNVKKLSEMFHNQPVPAAKRISYWVNHVSMYGGEHLRSKAHKLTLAEFLMLDIYGFITLIVLVFMIILCIILYCGCKFMSKCCKIKILERKEKIQ